MQNLFSVDIFKFRTALRDITFDLFLKVSENHFAHVFSKTTGLDYHRLEKYIDRGVRELFVQESDRAGYEAFISVTPESVFNDTNVSHEKRVAALLNMTEQNLAGIFARFNVDDETATSSKKLVRGYVELMTDEPQSLAVILKLISYGNYLYYHAVAVSVFSLLLARALGQYDMQTLEVIGMGGFLHDIGRTQLPKEVNECSTDLTPEQWEVMKTHPKLGLNMLEKAKGIPEAVRFIVYQHHEQPGGGGYPNALRGTAIYAPAKIVGICDAFSALISARPWRPPFSVEQAIEVMESESGKFDKTLLKNLEVIFSKKFTSSKVA